MSKHFREHRGALEFQMAVPQDVRDVCGAKWWRAYVTVKHGRSQALAKIDQLAAHHIDLIAHARSLPVDQRKPGCLDPVHKAALERILAIGRERRPVNYAALPDAQLRPMLEMRADGERLTADVSAELAHCQAVALVAAPAAGNTMAALVKLWADRTGAAKTAEHYATARLFVSHIGEVDARRVNKGDIRKFRDRIATDMDGNGEPRSPKNQTRQLERLSAMYGVAVSEGWLQNEAPDENPVAGITVHGKDARAPKIKQQPFKGWMTHRVLEAAKFLDFGAERHVAVLWLLKLMAYTGCRPNEVAQLQRADVGLVDGEPCITITQVDANTGKKHKLKSTKNEKSEGRIVPLHPDVAGFLAYTQSRNTDFVFEELPHTPGKGRAHWFSLNFGAFLADCGIVAKPGSRVSTYSFRHGFKDACDRANVPEGRRKLLMGHAGGIAGGYGGDIVRTLAADVARVDVLTD